MNAPLAQWRQRLVADHLGGGVVPVDAGDALAEIVVQTVENGVGREDAGDITISSLLF